MVVVIVVVVVVVVVAAAVVSLPGVLLCRFLIASLHFCL